MHVEAYETNYGWSIRKVKEKKLETNAFVSNVHFISSHKNNLKFMIQIFRLQTRCCCLLSPFSYKSNSLRQKYKERQDSWAVLIFCHLSAILGILRKLPVQSGRACCTDKHPVYIKESLTTHDNTSLDAKQDLDQDLCYNRQIFRI